MVYLNDDAVWEAGVRRLEETDDCTAGVFNEPFGQLARRTAALKEMAEAETAAREEGERAFASRLNAVEGRGGPVAARDFGTKTPAQEALTQYACEAIWGRAEHSCGTVMIRQRQPIRWLMKPSTWRRRYSTAHGCATRITA